ncbi:deazaflavin-dependent oxidoreductase, nitroreductase family [Micromonospora coriariae]|uniref:Deazaflavin-dependent oxidoreductase, nitroreductase family n=1 Tax=Micromonospora coriariae TaxID=285665 RepID=A0A1C4XBJ2_9ACTN|nr:nitroreductase/quinone reductase family protein [Micromonospora coriariae]SCF05858.1 deazaflavin-dependent oxidoreductase, nitroreductase family [Micromonospora coriariae]
MFSLAEVPGALQQRLINPIVRRAWDWKLPIPGDALLETTGRRTGQRRYTPVCDGLDGDVFWLVAQRGRRADWVRNVEADPRVRVKVGGGRHARWRAGTARMVEDDDPSERQRILARSGLMRRLCLRTSKAMNARPLTVRVDLDPP